MSIETSKETSMSNLLEQASLVLIPSGYKEDVVYSEIPLDGSGDMVFTRSSNGTRINSAGLVEVVPWNLVQYSEDFTNAVYSKYNNITATADQTSAPNGTTTADKIGLSTASTTFPNLAQDAQYIVGQVYTFSVYFKKNTVNFGKIRVGGTAFASSTNSPLFNLNTGVIVSGTGTIENVGGGWYRCTITATADTSAAGGFAIDLPDSTGVWSGSSVYNVNDSIFAWGFMSNIGSTAKPYFPTTDRLNVPRLTYQNGGGGCPSLLLEKQSTNVNTYSEQFDNVGWSLSGVTVSANQTTSPDGTQNADKLIESSANVLHEIYQAQSLTNGVTYTNTIYAKSAERTQIAINFVSGGFGQGANVIADLSAGTLGTVSNYGSVTGSTATITNVGNGWYRISLTMTPATTTTFYADYSPALNGNITYQGNGTSGVFIWGAQIEQSTYPTSYINTTSASATRVKDLAYNTSATSLIGQSEGVLFCDFNLPSIESDVDYPFIVDLFGSTGYRFGFARYPNGGVHIYMQNNFSAQFTYNTTQLTGRFKLALGYKANDCVIYLNGTLLQTITSATIPATSGIAFNAIDNNGAYNSQSQINQCVLFKTRLTNAELASLTTL